MLFMLINCFLFDINCKKNMLNIVGYNFFLLFLMLIIKNNFKVVNNFIVIKYLNGS